MTAARKTDLRGIERRANLREEARTKARADEADIEAHRAELMAQADLRGAAYQAPAQQRGERRKPIRRVSGLDWLKSKARINDDQHAAGERYGAAFRRTLAEPPLKSILNRDVGSSDGRTLAAIQAHADGTERARNRLAAFRRQLLGNRDLIEACDAVCGLEKTPRESAQNGRDAERVEAVLLVALDMLALHLAPALAARPQDAV